MVTHFHITSPIFIAFRCRKQGYFAGFLSSFTRLRWISSFLIVAMNTVFIVLSPSVTLSRGWLVPVPLSHWEKRHLSQYYAEAIGDAKSRVLC